MSSLLHDPVAHWLVVATAVAVVVGEVVATISGRLATGSVMCSAARRTH